MSLAFSIAVQSSRVTRSLGWLTLATGLAGALLTLRGLWQREAWVMAALGLAMLTVIALRLLRQARRGSRSMARTVRPPFARGWLQVDEAGAATWMSTPGRQPVALAALDWYAGRRVTSLRCQPADGGPPFHLLIGREVADPDAWRRLHAWLSWQERGGRPGGTL